MSTYFIENFGCRATDADAAAIRRALADAGLVSAPERDQADVAVLNSCTVTAAADAQTREVIRKIHRANPATRIVVTGCYAQRAPEEIAALEGVACVVGNGRQEEIPGVVRQLLALQSASNVNDESKPGRRAPDFVLLAQLDTEAMSLARGPAKILTSDIFAGDGVPIAPVSQASDRTRPILKIQDGCNNRCSYCVIPLVRGRSRSMAPDGVVAAAANLVASGAREVVLSGINLGAYGRDLHPRVNLAVVVRRILDETPLERLRFSSIEPQDITEDFAKLVASSPRIAPHFHIPLQSGCDRILRAMHRWYRTAHYAERIEIVHRLMPHAAIGADVIAGFPGETAIEFRETMDFIERLPFSYLHVFSFSARPGTGGASLAAPLDSREIRDRAGTLRALGQAKARSFRAAQAGKQMRALTLARRGEDHTEALTGNYLKVRVAGHRKPNEWCDVVPSERADDALEPVNCDAGPSLAAENAPALCAHS